MTHRLTVTTQDVTNVKEILAKHNVENASIKVIATGSKFAKAFDVLVNGVRFATYYGAEKDLSTGLTGQYTYKLVA